MNELYLTAYRLDGNPTAPLVPAGPDRVWMRDSPERGVYHCLPFLMANQSGWLILSSHRIRVVWDGSTSAHGLKVEYLAGPAPYPALSHFGNGILTWRLPYLFRTPPGWNLLVRGPANHIKDGVQALEGLVETDWTPAAFTMNWKLTRPEWPVTFDEGEPIAMLTPQRRGELENFQPVVKPIESDEHLHRTFQQWARARARFLFEREIPLTDAYNRRWQQDYVRGENPDGTRADVHETRRHLRSFEQSDDRTNKRTNERTDEHIIEQPNGQSVDQIEEENG